MKTIALFISLFSTQALYANGAGVSTHPLPLGQKLISTEFTGALGKGGGVGFQSRYTRKLLPRTIFDMGLAISGGERTSRLFVGTDLELLPEYLEQPRFSTKVWLENAKEADGRQNKLAIAPTLSKGFSFWGHLAWPHVSIPYSVNLNDYEKTYSTSLGVNLGISGILPFLSRRDLIGHAELNVGLRNSYTGMLVGVSWPMNN